MSNLILMLACGPAQGAEGAENAGSGLGGSWWMILAYIAFFGILMYFIAIRPQRKQKKKQEEMMNSMENGDTVLTTSGFYGTIIDIAEDVVIVEFGNNKNCRIPMQKSAIVEIEKAEGDKA